MGYPVAPPACQGVREKPSGCAEEEEEEEKEKEKEKGK